MGRDWPVAKGRSRLVRALLPCPRHLSATRYEGTVAEPFNAMERLL